MRMTATSRLIVGGDKALRLAEAERIASFELSADDPDVFWLEGERSIGVEQIKGLKKALSKKAYKRELKVCFIEEAEKLTEPAQNALLKTLEEPPGDSLLILATQSEAFLLETVVSRCLVVNLSFRGNAYDQKRLDDEVGSVIKKVLVGNYVAKIEAASEVGKDRLEAMDWVRKLIDWQRYRLRNNPSLKGLKVLKMAEKAWLELEANVNVSLVMEELFFDLV